MDIIMMGDSNAGRSSIAKIIFQKMMIKQTMMLGITNKIQNYQFKIHKIQFKVHDIPTKYDLTDQHPSEQMIFKNAHALIYVMNPQMDLNTSLENFVSVYRYMEKKNSSGCQFFLFINKADLQLTSSDSRDELMIKQKKKLADQGIDPKHFNIYLTSIYDYSAYEAFSKVVQKIIPCTPYICKLLNKLGNYCKVDKLFIFDIATKLFIGHNDDILLEGAQYEICSEMIDIYIDISALYYLQKKQDGAQNYKDSVTSVKLKTQKKQKKDVKQYFILQEMENCLCLGYLITESNYDRPYLIENNINKFKSGLFALLSETSNSIS